LSVFPPILLTGIRTDSAAWPGSGPSNDKARCWRHRALDSAWRSRWAGR
jgi:hypothetical protein